MLQTGKADRVGIKMVADGKRFAFYKQTMAKKSRRHVNGSSVNNNTASIMRLMVKFGWPQVGDVSFRQKLHSIWLAKLWADKRS
jgi:hypothetical protein